MGPWGHNAADTIRYEVGIEMKLTQLLGGVAALTLVCGMAARADTLPDEGNDPGGNDASVASSTFEVEGSVTQLCVLSLRTSEVNLGTIPIVTSGPDLFRMANPVGNDPGADNDAGDQNGASNAGCNDTNTVSITKQNGNLHNYEAAAEGMESDFTADLPYSVDVEWPQNGNDDNSLTAGTGDTTKASGPQHAWEGALDVSVFVPQDSRRLVAGEYEDNVTITLATD
jgi:hypothetical protein